MFYNELQHRFSQLIERNDLADKTVEIKARILSNEEAIGNPSRDDYPLLKGKEFLMEARFMDVSGQAYTDAPSELTTTLAEIANSKLDETSQRALFIATLNAVVRYLDGDLKTVHCRNDEPEKCADQIIDAIRPADPHTVGLVGLQPAILAVLSKNYGPQNVLCVDRDTSLRGASKHDVPILWGDEENTEMVFSRSDVVLSTGSTVVNGSLPNLLALSEKFQTPIFFYGTSIAGAARLMSLNHLCFEAS
ncbi:Rossmann-like domain-containing protein [Desulfuromonas acetoxidans]|uniref:Rossmann-like domain-containing protein n=1 Tax=Desulfuromonas acetoxidans TaxID=891 RepID=UPI00292F308B|nr:DUF364 domain-containing protein [Desulfuromonas acetoxidans]